MLQGQGQGLTERTNNKRGVEIMGEWRNEYAPHTVYRLTEESYFRRGIGIKKASR